MPRVQSKMIILPLLVMTMLLLRVPSAWSVSMPGTNAGIDMSFKSFYEKVLIHYPQLKAAHSDVELALARQMQVSAGFWPSLSVSAGVMETDDPVNVFGLLMRQERFSQGDFELNRLNTPRHQRDIQGGVHARWVLFDAMQTIRSSRAAREEVKAAQNERDFLRMEAFILAHDAYINHIALQAMLSAALAEERAAGDDLKKAEELKNKGMVLGADFYAAKVRAGHFSKAVQNLQRQLEALNMLMNVMMGEAVTHEFSISAGLPDQAFEVVSAESLARDAQVLRPDLQAVLSRVSARREELMKAKEGILPSVVLTADGTNNRRDLSDAGGYNAAAALKVELPVFERVRSGRVRQAQAELDKALHEADAFKDEVAREIIKETARFETLRLNYDIDKAMADDAAQAVELLVPLYNEGRKSVLDLEEARSARLGAVQSFIQLKAKILAAQARLYFLGGKLNAQAIEDLSSRMGG